MCVCVGRPNWISIVGGDKVILCVRQRKCTYLQLSKRVCVRVREHNFIRRHNDDDTAVADDDDGKTDERNSIKFNNQKTFCRSIDCSIQT